MYIYDLISHVLVSAFDDLICILEEKGSFIIPIQ